MTGPTTPQERPVLSYAQIQAKNRAAENPKNMALGRTVANSGAIETYTGHGITPARAGADDHQQFKSLGLGAQVKVRTV